MKIIYEDTCILVCYKPHGMLSQSDSKGIENAVSVLEQKLKTDIFPIHRLDKGTAGLMVFAKTKKAAAELSRQITENKFTKLYTAVVHGAPEPQSGTLCDLLFYDRKAGKSYVVKRERAGVKKAVLHYETSASYETPQGIFSKLLIRLETGRTHQIRVQFASRGMPLAGDRRYGANDTRKDLALISCELDFFHPQTKEKLSFKTETDNLI